MKSWIKAVMWLLFFFVILVFVIRNGAAPMAVLTPGPTCDSYYYEGRDLRTCPKMHEFSMYWQACVPIGEDGCTALVRPLTITVDDFDCSKRRYVRDLRHPCSGIRDCRTNRIYYSDRGRCYDSVVDGINNCNTPSSSSSSSSNCNTTSPPPPIDCMDVPGCRHLADIHFKYDDDDERHQHYYYYYDNDLDSTSTFAVDVIAARAARMLSKG
ncbi:agip109 [Agrotis ipsilon multiple nucleopolyhedrovirus]|uniref:Uncharacterized protein n=1 Tax=Agrotis ipsilon multiple nucleopolyhedrovirus TaxID=208013 RepID=B6D623_9ABAC|nr:agip109 [Agrotis ipsilon multiple nucleopolyhedrovirus]ACI28810.1 unknown [Agrotis ipsilon multiple nucleopolyhedrovirus]